MRSTTSSRNAIWLEQIGLRAPEDIGLAHLNLAEDVAGWAGIDPLIEEVAAAAVDLLVGVIHRHETGSPSVQKFTMIRGTGRREPALCALAALERENRREPRESSRKGDLQSPPAVANRGSLVHPFVFVG